MCTSAPTARIWAVHASPYGPAPIITTSRGVLPAIISSPRGWRRIRWPSHPRCGGAATSVGRRRHRRARAGRRPGRLAVATTPATRASSSSSASSARSSRSARVLPRRATTSTASASGSERERIGEIAHRGARDQDHVGAAARLRDDPRRTRPCEQGLRTRRPGRPGVDSGRDVASGSPRKPDQLVLQGAALGQDAHEPVGRLCAELGRHPRSRAGPPRWRSRAFPSPPARAGEAERDGGGPVGPARGDEQQHQRAGAVAAPDLRPCGCIPRRASDSATRGERVAAVGLGAESSRSGTTPRTGPPTIPSSSSSSCTRLSVRASTTTVTAASTRPRRPARIAFAARLRVGVADAAVASRTTWTPLALKAPAASSRRTSASRASRSGPGSSRRGPFLGRRHAILDARLRRAGDEVPETERERVREARRLLRGGVAHGERHHVRVAVDLGAEPCQQRARADVKPEPAANVLGDRLERGQREARVDLALGVGRVARRRRAARRAACAGRSAPSQSRRTTGRTRVPTPMPASTAARDQAATSRQRRRSVAQ